MMSASMLSKGKHTSLEQEHQESETSLANLESLPLSMPMFARTAQKEDKKKKLVEPVKIVWGSSNTGEKCVNADASCEWDDAGPGWIIEHRPKGLLCLQNIAQYGKGWNTLMETTCEKADSNSLTWPDGEEGLNWTHPGNWNWSDPDLYNWTDGDFNWTDGDFNWTDGDFNWTDGDFNWTAGDFNWTAEDLNWTDGDFNWTGGDFNWTAEDFNWTAEDLNWTDVDFNWTGGDFNWTDGDFNWTDGDFNWTAEDFNWTGPEDGSLGDSDIYNWSLAQKKAQKVMKKKKKNAMKKKLRVRLARRKLQELVQVTWGTSSKGEKCVKAKASCTWKAAGPGFLVQHKVDGSVCLQNIAKYGAGWTMSMKAVCKKKQADLNSFKRPEQ